MRDDDVLSDPFTITLSAGQSGVVHVPGGALPAKTDYKEASPTFIPNLPHADKYVGIPAYRARAGQKADNSWKTHDLNVTASSGSGEYGTQYFMSWQTHYGGVDAFNVLGRSEKQGFSYKLDTDSNLGEVPITPQGGM